MIVAVEGPDGSGKSTLAPLIVEHINIAQPGRAVLSKEPVRMRDATLPASVLDPIAAAANDERDEAKLQRLIAHSMLRGAHLASWGDLVTDPQRVLVLDRFWLSTVVHQSSTSSLRGYTLQELYNALLCCCPWPKVWIVMDTRPNDCLERVRSRGERMKHSQMTHLHKRYKDVIRMAYLQTPNSWRVYHAAGDADPNKEAKRLAWMIRRALGWIPHPQAYRAPAAQ